MTAETMSQDEIDEFLRTAGAGVLSLTSGRETYAIPESFGYDGEYLYFQLVYDQDSEKMEYIETTDVATFTVFSEDPARSVIARGSIEPVPKDEELTATNAIAENAVIPTLNVSTEKTTAELAFTYYRLDLREISGRRFGPQMSDVED